MIITEKKFKKVLIIFLTILFVEFIMILFPWTMLSGKCADGFAWCLAMDFLLFFIISIFWLSIWYAHHRIFYTDRYKVKGMGENDSKLTFFIKSLFLQKYFFNSIVGRALIGGTTLLFCLGVIYLFFYLSYNLIKLI